MACPAPDDTKAFERLSLEEFIHCYYETFHYVPIEHNGSLMLCLHYCHPSHYDGNFFYSKHRYAIVESCGYDGNSCPIKFNANGMWTDHPSQNYTHFMYYNRSDVTFVYNETVVSNKC